MLHGDLRPHDACFGRDDQPRQLRRVWTRVSHSIDVRQCGDLLSRLPQSAVPGWSRVLGTPGIAGRLGLRVRARELQLAAGRHPLLSANHQAQLPEGRHPWHLLRWSVRRLYARQQQLWRMRHRVLSRYAVRFKGCWRRGSLSLASTPTRHGPASTRCYRRCDVESKQKPGRHRSVVERPFAWLLGGHRRLASWRRVLR